MKLLEYQRRRDEARTNEPFGTEPKGHGPTRIGAFVVHLHDATRLHFDLRIESAGVLASFAVPKGPSLDPAEKRLSVRTEDHPIEYTDFEAVIPDGNYGAGPMILWDRGRIRYLDGPVEEGLEKGKIDFELWGYKLRGRFALVRIKGTKNEWLFFKKPDRFASTERDPVLSEPRSVLSGLQVDELAEAARIAADIEERALALGAPAGVIDSKQPAPMLCAANSSSLAEQIQKGRSGQGADRWVYELKLDGVRAIATKIGRDVILTGRTQRESTDTYPEIARAVESLPAERVVLDGEIIAVDETGKPNFQRLGHRIHLRRRDEIARAVVEVPVMYVVFDLLAVGSRDLRPLPLLKRKELLRRLLPSKGVIQMLDHFEGDPTPVLAFCREQGLEGIVAKQKDSPYRPGPRRGSDWVKIKCEREADFVVVGYTRGEGGRNRLGALDVASFSGPELRYRGKVGSGLEERTMELLRERLDALRTDKPAAGGHYHSANRGRTHVRPELVVSVRFLGYSDDGHLRHPVFRGIRDDIDPAECTAAPPVERLESPPPEIQDDTLCEPEPDPEPTVAITNPKKVLWPGEGFTKQDLCRYYETIAPVLLPFLRDRPVVLVRYPDGIQGKHFYQWNAPPVIPKWVETLRLRRDEGSDEVETFLATRAATLVYLANLAAIPIHVLACRAGSLHECDFFTIDFDISGGSLSQAIRLCKTLHELLAAIGLTGFPKTSGQSGLHVFVPLGPGISFMTARTLGELLGRLLVRMHPDAATMERSIARRGPRVYVDTGQTGRSRTIVAPYAVRAHPGATVSTPLRWEEVEDGLDPARFTIESVPGRVAAEGDLMAGLLSERPDVPEAVTRLGSLVGAEIR